MTTSGVANDTNRVEPQEERIRDLELRVEAISKEPAFLRAEFRVAILELEMRMKEYVDQRISKLEARVDFHFKIMMTMHATTLAGIAAITGRLLYMA